MPQQNISITQGETKNFEFEHSSAGINDKVWFTMYNGRDPVIYKESEKYGGSSDQIEIVTTGNKKYIVKVKGIESEKLWLSNVSYKLYWINPTTEETELLYWGSVNVSPQQQQQQEPKLLGHKYIQVWDQLPDPNDFQEGDLIQIDGELKIKRENNWNNLFGIKNSVLEIIHDLGEWFFNYFKNEIGLGTPYKDEETPIIYIPFDGDGSRIIVEGIVSYNYVTGEYFSLRRQYSESNITLILDNNYPNTCSIMINIIQI